MNFLLNFRLFHLMYMSVPVILALHVHVNTDIAFSTAYSEKIAMLVVVHIHCVHVWYEAQLQSSSIQLHKVHCKRKYLKKCTTMTGGMYMYMYMLGN